MKIIKYYGCLDNKGGASQRAIVRPPAPKRAPPTLPTQGPITPQTHTHLPKHTHTLTKTDLSTTKPQDFLNINLIFGPLYYFNIDRYFSIIS